MENEKVILVETLSQFIEWAAQFSDGQYLFRGVSTENYKIEASAYRRLPEIDRNNPSKLLKINKDLIEKARSLGHDQRDTQQLSDLELLAELQHFGAATCLIDFSRSALVALWFACQQGSQTEANGKVFAVRHDDMVRLKTVNPELITEDIDYFFQPDENGRYPLYQWQPKLQNNRIIAQQSVFVFSGAQEEAVCVIENNSKQNILIALDKISGITEANIYPDFDGFARLHAHNEPYIEPDPQDYLQRGIEAHQIDEFFDVDQVQWYLWAPTLDSLAVDTQRMTMQQSVFLFGSPEVTGEMITQEIVIRSEHKENLRTALAKMGISEKTLFSDLLGFFERNTSDQPYDLTLAEPYYGGTRDEEPTSQSEQNPPQLLSTR